MSREPKIDSPVNEDVMNRTDMLTNVPDDVWGDLNSMEPPADPMNYASGSDAYSKGGKNGKRK